jgi:hypothetical protein
LRRVLILSTVLIAACAASGAAMAQAQGQTQTSTTADGLRYLSWPGKAKTGQAAAPRAAAPSPTPVGQSLPLPRIAAPAPAVPSTRRGLTPASDWTTPQAPASSVTLQPYVPSREAAAHAPTPPVHAQTAAAPSPVPSALPDQVLVEAQGQAEPAPVAAVFDPMAPRRDAPIFRLQAQAAVEAPRPAASETPGSHPALAPQTGAPPQIVQAALSTAPVLGARFYSVHRQAGRKPDPIAAVQPIYLDALPVEMTQTPSSADLARPDGPPALLRNSDGAVRAAPQTQEDDLP